MLQSVNAYEVDLVLGNSRVQVCRNGTPIEIPVLWSSQPPKSRSRSSVVLYSIGC